MEKVNLKSKHIFIVIIFLLAAVSVLAWFNKPASKFPPNTLSIVQNNILLKTFNLEEIKALPSVQVEKTIYSSKEADDSGIFTGVPLVDILSIAGKDTLKDATQIITKAEDNFQSAFSLNEVLAKENILVVYEKDGKGIGTAEEGGSGPLRIVVIGDDFGNRSTKHLNEIEVK